MDELGSGAERIVTAVLGTLRELAGMLLDPSERIFWGFLLSAGLIALLERHTGRHSTTRRTPGRGLFSRSSWVDLQLLVVNIGLRSVGAVVYTMSAFGAAVWLVARLDAWLGVPQALGVPTTLVAAIYTVVMFVAWDASRYLVHRWMHRVAWLWELHQVHHSAKTLTPLTLYRTHPIENLLFGIRGVVVTGSLTAVFFYLFRRDAIELELLGINVFGFVFNLVGSNLRHSHVWWSWGRLERVLMSPAQHQMHHAVDGTSSTNLGTWIALWDHWAGTLRCAGELPPRAFGLPAAHINHDPDRLWSALWQPLIAALARGRGRGRGRSAVTSSVALATMLAGATGQAHAAPPAESPAVPAGPAPAPTASPAPATSGAPADEAQTRTVIVGSMFEGDELPRVAGSAHVVGAKELEQREYDDVHRVLATVPGVYVRGEDGFGLRPNIGLRGANPDRSAKITLMEDGILLGPAPYSAPAAYYFPLTTRMVGVEVFKGPASIRHGPNTIGGAINLRTRQIPQEPASTIDLAGGRFGYVKGHGFFGTTYRGIGVLLEVARIQSDGFKQLDGGGDTGFAKNDAMLKVGYEARTGPDTTHRVVLKSGVATERSNETYLGLSRQDFERTPYRRYAASARDRMTWWRSQAELGYTVGGERLELQTDLYRHDFRRVWRRLDHFRDGPDLSTVLANPDAGQLAVLSAVLRGEEDAASPEQALIVTSNDRKFVSEGIQSALHWRPDSSATPDGPGDRIFSQDLEIGFRLHHDAITRTHTEDAYLMTSRVLVPEGTPSVTALRNRGETHAVALHVHDTMTFFDRLTVAPGVRFESVSMGYVDDLGPGAARRHDLGITPGIGVLYAALPWMDAFAGVHRGFSPVAPGQPESVKPEYSVNYEAGVRAIRRRLWVEAVGFFSDYSNLNGLCTFSSGCGDGDGSQQFNAGKVFVYGLESLARYRQRWRNGLRLELGARYTYTGSQFRRSFSSAFGQWGDVTVGDQLPYVPTHVAGGSIGLGGEIWDVSVAPAFTGAMRDVAGQGAIASAERIDGFLVVDASAELRVFDRLRVYTQLGNATGSAYVTSYRPYGLRPGAPLTFMVGIKADMFAPVRRDHSASTLARRRHRARSRRPRGAA